MHLFLRMLAAVLLVAMIAARPGVQALALPSAPAAPPAPCHQHRPAAPASVPAGLQCCISGHHWAAPGAAFSLQPLMLSAILPKATAFAPLIPMVVRPLPVSCFNSPPGTTLLRV